MVQSLEQTEQLLEAIGLTRQEAKCYLALYSINEAQSGEISKKSGIATANLYPVLYGLIKKGMVSYRVHNNKKIFIANSPETLEAFIEKRQETLNKQKEEVKDAISNLKKGKLQKEPQSNYKYFEGITGIKALWYELRETLASIDKENMVKICTEKKSDYQLLLGFLEDFHTERLHQGIKQRIIYPVEEKELGQRRRQQQAEVRFLSMNNDVAWGVVGNRVFLQHIRAKTPGAFLIHDDVYAKTFENVFDNLWKAAKE